MKMRDFVYSSMAIALGLLLFAVSQFRANATEPDMSGSAQAQIESLVEKLQSEDSTSRQIADAAEELGGYGVKASIAVDALTQKLSMRSARVVLFVAEALGKIGAKAIKAVPELRRMCEMSKYRRGYSLDLREPLRKIADKIEQDAADEKLIEEQSKNMYNHMEIPR